MELIRSQSEPIPKPFEILGHIFRFSIEDEKLWWDSTAPMFASMLANAGYDTHLQYKYLCLHREYIIPTLGPYPKTGEVCGWKSVLTRYGLPYELSLNCQGSGSLVRFAFEPVGDLAGTDKDPFNTKAIWDCLNKLAGLNIGLDTKLFRGLVNELVISDAEKDVTASNDLLLSKFKTQNKLAIDLKGKDILVKTYIYPSLKSLATGVPLEKLITDAIRKVDHGDKLRAPLSSVDEYLESRRLRLSHGSKSTHTPLAVSCDLVEPSRSRIKMYSCEQQVDFATLADIWTLGGKRQDDETMSGLSYLKQLWELLSFTEGYREVPTHYYNLGISPEERLPLLVQFGLLPGNPDPEKQVYLPAFGENDMTVANALTAFFELVGWKELAQTYKKNLSSY